MSGDDRSIDVQAMQAPIAQAIGLAISAFSTVESQLAFAFSWLMYPANAQLALIAFDSIQLTSPKLRTLRAVAKVRLDAEFYEELQALLKRVDARTEIRTKLAHWVISICHPDGLAITKFDERLEARLVPPWFSAKNLNFDATESLSIDDVKAFTEKCAEVSNGLMSFVMKLQTRVGSLK